MRTQREVRRTQKRALTRLQPCWCSDLEHPCSRTMRNNFLLFPSHSIYGTLLWQPKWTKMPCKLRFKESGFILHQMKYHWRVFNQEIELFYSFQRPVWLPVVWTMVIAQEWKKADCWGVPVVIQVTETAGSAWGTLESEYKDMRYVLGTQ